MITIQFFVFLLFFNIFSNICQLPNNICVYPSDNLQSVLDTVSKGDSVFLRSGNYSTPITLSIDGGPGIEQITIAVYPHETVNLIESSCSSSSIVVSAPYYVIESGKFGVLNFIKRCVDFNPFIDVANQGFFSLKGPNTFFLSGINNAINFECSTSSECDGLLVEGVNFDFGTGGDVGILVNMENSQTDGAAGSFKRVQFINNVFYGDLNSFIFIENSPHHITVFGNEFWGFGESFISINVSSYSQSGMFDLCNNVFITINNMQNLVKVQMNGNSSLDQAYFQNNLVVTGANSFSNELFIFSGYFSDSLSNVLIQNCLFDSDNSITQATSMLNQFYEDSSFDTSGLFFRWNRQTDSGTNPVNVVLENVEWMVNNVTADSFNSNFKSTGKKAYPFYWLQNNIIGHYFVSSSPSEDFHKRTRSLDPFTQGPFNFDALNGNGCKYNLDGPDCDMCENGEYYNPLNPQFGECSECIASDFNLNNDCNTCVFKYFDPISFCLDCTDPLHNLTANCSQCIDSYDVYQFPDCSECILPNYNKSENCQTCLNHFDLSHNCEICEFGYDIQSECVDCLINYDDSVNCTSCVYNYDLDENCTACRNYYNIDSFCTTCIDHFDLSHNCEICEFGYDIQSECVDCLINYDDSVNCTSCVYNYDLDENCTVCRNYYDIDTLCTICLPGYNIQSECADCFNVNYLPSSQCSDCINNYNISTSCIECDFNYNISTLCTECINQYDKTYNCLECRDNYDIDSDCLICLPNYDINNDCKTCVFGYDIDVLCGACLPNYDSSQDCSQCIDKYEMDFNCSHCIGSYDLDTNCVQCIGNFDITQDCDTCKNMYDPRTLCETCLFNFDIQTDCSECRENYDIVTNCQECNEGFEEDDNICVSRTVDNEILSTEAIIGLVVGGGLIVFVLVCLLVLTVVIPIVSLIEKKKEKQKIGEVELDEVEKIIDGGEEENEKAEEINEGTFVDEDEGEKKDKKEKHQDVKDEKDKKVGEEDKKEDDDDKSEKTEKKDEKEELKEEKRDVEEKQEEKESVEKEESKEKEEKESVEKEESKEKEEKEV